MTTAWIGIGSNVGDRVGFCRRAVTELEGFPGVAVEAASSIYETTPVGGPPQRSFMNLVVRIETSLEPRGLLEACQQIERILGREESDIRWGPRTVDLDVLLFGEEKISEPDLEIPHPRLTQRRFVLAPLLEVDPAATDPWGTPLADFLPGSEGEAEIWGAI